MRPLSQFPLDAKTDIQFVLTDIDDTLTLNGRLPAVAFVAMERLHSAGFKVIPITGRPAGWCDHIARMWHVDAVVGENGAFYFYYDHKNRKMIRRYWKSEKEREADRARLDAIRDKVISEVPGARVAADQAYREADLAIDFCEDVPPLPASEIDKIVAIFEAAGAAAKISSIHVNGWFGDYDKLSMTRLLFREVFYRELDQIKQHVVFIGDSPNDVPMFRFFPHSIGVANIEKFCATIEAKPARVTRLPGGFGFAEVADNLIKANLESAKS
ncbi:HAD-IIB family hydrolase [candidate division KSB1 bacterium]|nr:HAD-IIB family hydrolase [candidate division KSB1 bacterium]